MYIVVFSILHKQHCWNSSFFFFP
uniref:Uncharacterized protein n=1 Tax=Arundo donax TaxID=35708 RepID=A0A0A8Y5L4_ARUDO